MQGQLLLGLQSLCFTYKLSIKLPPGKGCLGYPRRYNKALSGSGRKPLTCLSTSVYMRFKNLECAFWIRSEVFEFGVSFFEFGVRFWNLEWGFGIRSEFFWIWSDVFEFGVRFWNLEWGSRIRSQIFEFGVRFLNLEWDFWNSEWCF